MTSPPIFVDTSALFALLVADDRRHEAARNAWNEHVIAAGCELVTTNYVVAESYDLARRRIGMNGLRAVDALVRSAMQILFVDRQQHDGAVALLFERNRRQLSFVDCLSFVVARDNRIERVFAYDDDFEREGFVCL